MNNETLKGRLLFDPEGNTFYELVSLFELEPEFDPMRRLNLIDLAEGKENVSRFLQEIGEDLIIVPLIYPRPKIDKFLQAAKEYAAAKEIMLAIHQEILFLTADEDCSA